MKKTATTFIVLFSLSSYTQVPRVSVVEQFSSVTCLPCTPAANYLEGILADPVNDEKHVYVKYPMSWPSTGDPYYSPSSAARQIFYAVIGLPRTFIDAQGFNTNDVVQADLDAKYAVPAWFEISSEFMTGGQFVSVDIEIEALMDIPDTVRLYTAIFENGSWYDNTITGIEYHNILKKMLPNPNGAAFLPVTTGEVRNFSFLTEFKGEYRKPDHAFDYIDTLIEHTIEEFDDLGVAVWLQNPVTKEIYQAAYASYAGSFDDMQENQTSRNLSVFPNPAWSAVSFELARDGSDQLLEVTDASGRLVLRHEISEEDRWKGLITLPVDTWKAGIYVIRVQTAKGVVSQMFVVSHE